MPVSERDLALDKELAELCGLVPLLSLVTPVNVAEARRGFFEEAQTPDFEYRRLPDLDDIQKRLDGLSSEDADDPNIASLVEGLIRELRLRLEMLRTRGSDQFFLTAVEMYGHVDTSVLQLAKEILDVTPPDELGGPTYGAEHVAKVVEDELDRYRNQYPEMTARAIISESRPGVMVETGDVLIGENSRVAASRMEPLIHHEVGTHVLTYENGRAQPLHILGLGLARYDELQEALGVLAEHLSGGVSGTRLRVLAYRVIAAQTRSEGASFRECYRKLADVGCPKGTAFTTTMRAYRSGGMTKDAIYLQGLVKLLDHLAAGARMDHLFLGKVSFDAIPLVAELREMGVLSEPPLRPRFLDFKDAREKLARIRSGSGLEGFGGMAA